VGKGIALGMRAVAEVHYKGNPVIGFAAHPKETHHRVAQRYRISADCLAFT
jgi:hypothetical protein